MLGTHSSAAEGRVRLPQRACGLQLAFHGDRSYSSAAGAAAHKAALDALATIPVPHTPFVAMDLNRDAAVSEGDLYLYTISSKSTCIYTLFLANQLVFIHYF